MVHDDVSVRYCSEGMAMLAHLVDDLALGADDGSGSRRVAYVDTKRGAVDLDARFCPLRGDVQHLEAADGKQGAWFGDDDDRQRFVAYHALHVRDQILGFQWQTGDGDMHIAGVIAKRPQCSQHPFTILSGPTDQASHRRRLCRLFQGRQVGARGQCCLQLLVLHLRQLGSITYWLTCRILRH